MPRPAPRPPAAHRNPRIHPPKIIRRGNIEVHRTCGTEVEQGYGLAGGGIGVYIYCPKCEEVLVKFQDPGME